MRRLDASSCTKLKRILVSMRSSANNLSKDSSSGIQGLSALNLNGCRSLLSHGREGAIFGPATHRFTRNLRTADLSSTSKLTESSTANMLRSATKLTSLSLRYVATDAIISALAETTTAVSSLGLVDVAFSSKLTDTPVRMLASKAARLQRLNLRGCRSISTACYNEVPIALEKRRLKRERGEIPMAHILEQSSRSSMRAKGDNIFFFSSCLSSTALKKKRNS